MSEFKPYIAMLLVFVLGVASSCGEVTSVGNDAIEIANDPGTLQLDLAETPPDVGDSTDVGLQGCTDDSDCTSTNQCMTGICKENGSCGFDSTQAKCDDGEPCTDNDTCDSDGECVGSPMECDDGDPCNGSQTCFEGTCIDVEGVILAEGDECQSTGFCFAQKCQNFEVSLHGTECSTNKDTSDVYKSITIAGVTWAGSAFIIGINYCSSEEFSCAPRKNICRHTTDGIWNSTGGPWEAYSIESIKAMNKNLAVGASGSIGFYQGGQVNWVSNLQSAAPGNDDSFSITYNAVSRSPHPDGAGYAWFGGIRDSSNGVVTYSKLCSPLGNDEWSCNNLNPQANFNSEIKHTALIGCEDLEAEGCNLGLKGHWMVYKNAQGTYIGYGDAGAPTIITERHYIQSGIVNAMVPGINDDVWIAGTQGLLLNCSGSGEDASCMAMANFAEGTLTFMDVWTYEGGTLFLVRTAAPDSKNQLYILPSGADMNDTINYQIIEIPHLLPIEGIAQLGNVRAQYLEADPDSGTIIVVGQGSSGDPGTSDSVVLWSTSPVE